jgi:uncharacterized membrane protein
MQTLAKGFFKGLLILVPLVSTAWLLYVAITWVDGLLRVPIPGLGIAIVVTAVTAIGLLASNVIGKTFVSWMERALGSLPVVKLLYTSVKDLMGAFVGDKKSFDKPVMVDVGDGARVLGFVTCTRFDDPKLIGWVAVYLPQSYNFAGNLLLVPEARVQTIDADGAQFMAFIMSGGVADMNAARTVMDDGQLRAKLAAKG